MSRVFLSWSGEPSRSVAIALKHWLPNVLPVLQPWISHEDIHAGDRWSDEVARALAGTDFGIICVTEVNLASPWLNFEAGAVATSLQSGRVFPYLVQLPTSLVHGPLAQFQGAAADREGTLKLLLGMARLLTPPADSATVKASFEQEWPGLEALLSQLPEASEQLASEGYEWPRARSAETLCAFLSRLSSTQRGIFLSVIAEDSRLAPGPLRGYFQAQGRVFRPYAQSRDADAVRDEVGLSEAELVYRCKDLEHAELIATAPSTLPSYTVTSTVMRLINQSPDQMASCLGVPTESAPDAGPDASDGLLI